MKKRMVAVLLTLCALLALLPGSALAAEKFDKVSIHYQTVRGKWNGEYREVERASATVDLSNGYMVWADVPFWAEKYTYYDYDQNRYVEGSGSYTEKKWVYVMGPGCQITVNDPFWGTDGILCDDDGRINVEYMDEDYDKPISYTDTKAGFVRDSESIAFVGMKGQDLLDCLTAKESEGKLFRIWLYDGIAESEIYIYAAGGSEIPAWLEREKPSSWAAADVDAAIAAGLVPMYLRDDYTQPITRAEFCSLGVALYETYTGKEIERLKDLSFDDTIALDVLKMASLGIVNGVGNKLFDPDAALNREQAATILARLSEKMGHSLEKGNATFRDSASVSSWAAEAVGQVQAGGIMGGVGNNTFSPKDKYTREQSVVTILRLYGIVAQ